MFLLIPFSCISLSFIKGSNDPRLAALLLKKQKKIQKIRNKKQQQQMTAEQRLQKLLKKNHPNQAQTQQLAQSSSSSSSSSTSRSVNSSTSVLNKNWMEPSPPSTSSSSSFPSQKISFINNHTMMNPPTPNFQVPVPPSTINPKSNSSVASQESRPPSADLASSPIMTYGSNTSSSTFSSRGSSPSSLSSTPRQFQMPSLPQLPNTKSVSSAKLGVGLIGNDLFTNTSNDNASLFISSSRTKNSNLSRK